MAEQHSVKVTFSNGDHVTTTINGSEEEIRRYYIGNKFNIGSGGEDNMQTATSVEFLKSFDEHVRSIEMALKSVPSAMRKAVSTVACKRLGITKAVEDTQATCPYCGGPGVQEGDQDSPYVHYQCRNCHQTFSEPAKSKAVCSKCGGSGEYNMRECDACGGTGHTADKSAYDERQGLSSRDREAARKPKSAYDERQGLSERDRQAQRKGEYTDEEGNEEHSVECPACGGPAYLMGKLGGQPVWRCRNCGTDIFPNENQQHKSDYDQRQGLSERDRQAARKPKSKAGILDTVEGWLAGPDPGAERVSDAGKVPDQKGGYGGFFDFSNGEKEGNDAFFRGEGRDSNPYPANSPKHQQFDTAWLAAQTRRGNHKPGHDDQGPTPNEDYVAMSASQKSIVRKKMDWVGWISFVGGLLTALSGGPGTLVPSAALLGLAAWDALVHAFNEGYTPQEAVDGLKRQGLISREMLKV